MAAAAARRLVLPLITLLAALLAMGAAAQTVAEVGQFTGADRAARILAGAKEEGAVNIYFSVPLVQMNQIIDGFKAKYGIDVTPWRSESVDIARRTVLEQRSGRYNVDIIVTASPEMESLEREGVLQEVDLPVFGDLIAGAAQPGRAWVASHFVIFATAYNTNLVRPEDVPETFEDLRDPKYRGKIGIEAENANWLMEVAKLNGEVETVQLFRDIIETNGLSVRRGHSLMVNLVASGEVPIGINVYHDFAQEVQRTGAPIEILYLPPIIGLPIGIAAVKSAPHPHAAILFMEYMLTEGSTVMRDTFSVPANQVVAPLPEPIDMHILDVATYVDEVGKWRDLYNNLFVSRVR